MTCPVHSNLSGKKFGYAEWCLLTMKKHIKVIKIVVRVNAECTIVDSISDKLPPIWNDT